jgi:hypothetical protein
MEAISMTLPPSFSMFPMMNVSDIPSVYLTPQVALTSVVFLCLTIVFCFPACCWLDLLENCFVVCSCFVWSRNPHHLACADINRNLVLEGAVVELVTAAALVCGHRWMFHFPHFKIHTIHGHDVDSSIWIAANIRRPNKLLFFQRGNHSNPAPEIFALDLPQSNANPASEHLTILGAGPNEMGNQKGFESFLRLVLARDDRVARLRHNRLAHVVPHPRQHSRIRTMVLLEKLDVTFRRLLLVKIA